MLQFVRPLRVMLFEYFGYSEDRVDDLELYTELKGRRVNQWIDGRGLQVMVGRVIRNSDKNFFADAMFNELVKFPVDDIVIIDDLGKIEELESLAMAISSWRRTKEDHISRLTIVHLDERGTRHFENGERYPDDRVCLRAFATFTNPSLAELMLRVSR